MTPRGRRSEAAASEGPRFLARSEVARLLGVAPNTVTRWAREGRLASILTLGGHHRFERTAIEELRETLQRDVGLASRPPPPDEEGER